MEDLQKQGFGIHIARLCVVLVLVSGMVQAAHAHTLDRGPSHCSACVASHSPILFAPAVSVPSLAGWVESIGVVPESARLPQLALTTYIRPPPSAL